MKFFTKKELSCSCCGKNKMDDKFMDIISDIRTELGFPFIVTSAYRCPEYNDKVSSTGRNGPHTTGKAIDILVDRNKAYQLLELAFLKGIKGIGVSQKGNVRFIHLDECDRPFRTVWSY